MASVCLLLGGAARGANRTRFRRMRGGHGEVSLAVCRYIGFEMLQKRFWLFDTYGGITELSAELENARSKNRRHYVDF